MDVERVEKQLDEFIEKRAREAQDEQRIEALWAASARVHRRKLQRQNGLAWIAFHERMARQFLELAAEHHKKGEAITQAVEQLPKGEER